MRKYISVFCAAIMLVGVLSACGNSADAGKESTAIQIVTTIFPEYDWVKTILGDNPSNAEVTMLLDNGIDLHSYQPTAEDILKISTCDLFIYVGGESDEWVDDALKEAANPDMIAINLMDTLGDSVKEEEIVEGMEHEHEHEEGEHEEEHDNDNEHEDEEAEYDEHVWLSLDNAEVLCERIKDALAELDPENAAVYEANERAYAEALERLDDKYEAVVKSSDKNTILFGDRFPFRYLVDDYDLNYYAAFVGCSAETEASFETITFLAGKVDELSLSCILTIEGNDHKIAETIKSNTENKNQEILTLDSMQATTAEDVSKGVTYLSVMESNLEVLKKALQ